MNMLSLTCKTAIKAVVYLATKDTTEEKSGVKEIAKHIAASEHTVGKILQNLVRHNIIKSVKGPAGGFYLTEQQRLLPIITIVETIDGRDVFNKCGLGLSECSSTRPCPIHNEYKEGRELIRNLFSTKTIASLCEPVEDGSAYLKN